MCRGGSSAALCIWNRRIIRGSRDKNARSGWAARSSKKPDPDRHITHTPTPPFLNQVLTLCNRDDTSRQPPTCTCSPIYDALDKHAARAPHIEISPPGPIHRGACVEVLPHRLSHARPEPLPQATCSRHACRTSRRLYFSYAYAPFLHVCTSSDRTRVAITFSVHPPLPSRLGRTD